MKVKECKDIDWNLNHSCFYCGERIRERNEENIVKLNSNEYLSCPKCFGKIAVLNRYLSLYYEKMFDIVMKDITKPKGVL